jgi:hypothetical protein
MPPSVTRGSTQHYKLEWTSHSEAVACMLLVGQKSKMEIPV